MNRLAYSPFNHDEPRTVEELADQYFEKLMAPEMKETIYGRTRVKTFRSPILEDNDVTDAFTAGYKQAAQDAQAEITRLQAELKLAYKKIQELYDEQTRF